MRLNIPVGDKNAAVPERRIKKNQAEPGGPELQIPDEYFFQRSQLRRQAERDRKLTGDVFSSDRTAGTFAFSVTEAKRVFSDGATDAIERMVYTLALPVTLPPGNTGLSTMRWFRSRLRRIYGKNILD